VTDLRIGIVEDEPLLLQLLADNLQECMEHSVVATYRDGNSALTRRHPQLDVAVVDIDLGPGPDGIEVARAWRERQPSLGVVFLSHLRDPAILMEIGDDAGGLAYLHKRSATSVDVLVSAIEAVARGEVLIDPVLTEDQPAVGGSLADLTAHQRRILQAIAGGASNRSISESLGIPVKSVENATAGALRTLGIDGHDPHINVRVMAALAYLRLRQRTGQ